jgi:hypothetical protein
MQIKPHQLTRLAPCPQSPSAPISFPVPVAVHPPPSETLVKARAHLKRRGTRLESPPKREKLVLGPITEDGEAHCPASFVMNDDDSCEEGERIVELGKWLVA